MTFAQKVKKTIGIRKYKKLSTSEKQTIQEISKCQEITRHTNRDNLVKKYENLGLI